MQAVLIVIAVIIAIGTLGCLVHIIGPWFGLHSEEDPFKQ